jgi:hypothetical protein
LQQQTEYSKFSPFSHPLSLQSRACRNLKCEQTEKYP